MLDVDISHRVQCVSRGDRKMNRQYTKYVSLSSLSLSLSLAHICPVRLLTNQICEIARSLCLSFFFCLSVPLSLSVSHPITSYHLHFRSKGAHFTSRRFIQSCLLENVNKRETTTRYRKDRASE